MGLDNYIQHDVFEAVLVDRDSAGAVVDVKVLGYTSETSFSHTTESEDLRAGIGNKFFARLFKSKGVSFTITNEIGSDSMLEMTTGGKFKPLTESLATVETALVELETEKAVIKLENLPSSESDLVGTPKVLDQNNQPVNGTFTFSSKKIQLEGTELVGQEVKVVYFIKKTDLDGLAISAKTFPTAREIHLRSIVYDHDNNVVANVYYIAKRAIPNGNLDRSHAKGTNMTNQITFDCLEDSKGNYCYYFVEKL
jgi:hypothetical protein